MYISMAYKATQEALKALKEEKERSLLPDQAKEDPVKISNTNPALNRKKLKFCWFFWGNCLAECS
ncbi:hypothetical protein AAFN85_14045 [Mucilaginibacter sp. CAU 1740]|uniref:hypothetical protein n=1 Tax=Mucilaginibacter sp. CAU 1740 TaxID=3140365 RepID=UPI00325BCD8E